MPFGMTILAEERDKLYRYLAERNIIPEIQWILPIEYYSPGKDALLLSQHNLMLQCDQRYTIKDMDYIASTISEYFSKE